MNRLVQGIQRRWRRLHVDLGGRDATLLVVGSPRSGTTWLGDVLARATGSRILFEPFLVGRGLDFDLLRSPARLDREIDYDYPYYIPRDATLPPAVERQFRRILAGRIRADWVEQQAARGIYRRRLIKDVRANLFLGYVARHWPRIPIVVVFRDPRRVIDSQLQLRQQDWNFDWNPASALSQRALVDAYLADKVSVLQGAPEIVDRLAHRWCLESLVPLQECRNLHNVQFVSYQSLRSDEGAWQGIYDFLRQMGWPVNRVGFSDREQPSFTAVGSPTYVSRTEPPLRVVSKEQADRICLTAARYGLDALFRQKGVSVPGVTAEGHIAATAVPAAQRPRR